MIPLWRLVGWSRFPRSRKFACGEKVVRKLGNLVSWEP